MFVLVEPMLCMYFKNSDAYMLKFFWNIMKGCHGNLRYSYLSTSVKVFGKNIVDKITTLYHIFLHN